jgi:hypothetical protein
LSDPIKRSKYDSESLVINNASNQSGLPFVYYLNFTASKTMIRQFEEITFEFSFPSEARFFKRDKLIDWYLIEGPIIQHENIFIDGIERKETRIRYVLAPVNVGLLIFQGPSVTINNKKVYASPISFNVEPQSCSIHKFEFSSGTPLIIELIKAEIIKTQSYSKTRNKKRLIIIPVGSTFKRKQKQIDIVAKLITVFVCIVMLISHSSFVLLLLVAPLVYFLTTNVSRKLTNNKSQESVLFSNEVFKQHIAKGYSISRKNLIFLISYSIRSILKLN